VALQTRHEEELFVLLQSLLFCELVDELEWHFLVSNARNAAPVPYAPVSAPSQYSADQDAPFEPSASRQSSTSSSFNRSCSASWSTSWSGTFLSATLETGLVDIGRVCRTSTKEAIHEVIDELKAEAYAVGSGAADGKGFSGKPSSVVSIRATPARVSCSAEKMATLILDANALQGYR
jgi:hypothetical protein